MYYEAVKIDWEKAEKTDTGIPGIVATEEGGKLMLIDGWHRYAKALRTRLTEIPVVVLTEEETKQIRK
jgi:ParB-like chromosome segregation protein Spo0J